MNISVRTYLRGDAGDFVPIESATKSVITNPRYIEGAIELKINGTQILDTSLWDLVDQLWAYIADMLTALAELGEASTYFPDQPIQLTFKRIGRTVVRVACVVNGNVRSAVVDEVALTRALRDAGLAFFTKIQSLALGNEYTTEIERLTSA